MCLYEFPKLRNSLDIWYFQNIIKEKWICLLSNQKNNFNLLNDGGVWSQVEFYIWRIEPLKIQLLILVPVFLSSSPEVQLMVFFTLLKGFLELWCYIVNFLVTTSFYLYLILCSSVIVIAMCISLLLYSKTQMCRKALVCPRSCSLPEGKSGFASRSPGSEPETFP